LTHSLTFLALFSVSSKEHVVFEERKRERPRQREGGTNTGYASSQSSIVLHQSEGVAYLEEEQQQQEEVLEEDNWSNAMGALAFGSDDPRLSPGAVVGGGGGGGGGGRDLGNPSPSNDILHYDHDGGGGGGGGGAALHNRRTEESSLPSHQPTDMLTGQLGLSDMSAISHQSEDGDNDSETNMPSQQRVVSSSSQRVKSLLEEQQEIRVNLLLLGGEEELEERTRLRERLQWTQRELQSLEEE
jgi:hypothetical protein